MCICVCVEEGEEDERQGKLECSGFWNGCGDAGKNSYLYLSSIMMNLHDGRGSYSIFL